MIIRCDPPHKAQLIAVAFFAVVLLSVACSFTGKSTLGEAWIELNYFIDASVEVRIDIPPAKVPDDLQKIQFLSSMGSTPVRMFAASYDPGRGRDRDLLLTNIWGVIIQIDKDTKDSSAVSLEDIKNQFYLSRSDANRRFEFGGEQMLAGRKWLKVGLKAKPYGQAYSTPISKDLALVLAMTVYGDDANKTSLFAKRLQTLEEIVSRVKISNVDAEF